MSTTFVRLALLAAAAGCLAGCIHQRPAAPGPLEAAHAHNDYEHARPLHDALEQGFGSIEADIYLVEGALLVAHDRKDVRPERTLERLYLDPLRTRVAAHGGRVYRGAGSVTLLVDIKSEATSTYAALEAVLARYADILTRYEDGRTIPGAVSIIVSGNRSEADLLARPRRWSALDGRPPQLESELPASVYPLISENWSKLSRWRGVGEFPAADAATLQQWVRLAHERGRRLRFWNTPDDEIVWTVLRTHGVDVIGTDDLGRLRRFLTAAPGTPAP